MKYDYIYDQLFEGSDDSINIALKSVCLHDSILNIDGYKHSMVQIIAVTVALRMVTIIKNPPLVSDTYVFVALINELGGSAKINKEGLFIDAREIRSGSIPYFLGKQIHGSMYLCPALLMSLGWFEYFGSGGCQIGSAEENKKRPIDHIFSTVSLFGAKITVYNDVVYGKRENESEIEEIDIMDYSTNKDYLSGPLVGGATKTVLLMTMHSKHVIIKNAYIKTDVLDMIRFLKKLGERIEIVNGDIHIMGGVHVGEKQCIEFTLVQCISEIITYSTLAIAGGVKVRFTNLYREIIENSIKEELALFREIGATVEWNKNDLTIGWQGEIRSKDIVVLPTTIQSDHHPFFTLLLLYADTQSVLTECVWKDRFHYVNNLNCFGARICINGNQIRIKPSSIKKSDNDVFALDVRTAAVTLLAIILSKSEIYLKEAEHILRGYSRLAEQLHLLGADIEFVRINTNEGRV